MNLVIVSQPHGDQTTVQSRFFEPPRETKIGSKNRKVREIGSLLCSRSLGATLRDIPKTAAEETKRSRVRLRIEERERLLVRVIGRFEKMRVRKIGIPP